MHASPELSPTGLLLHAPELTDGSDPTPAGGGANSTDSGVDVPATARLAYDPLPEGMLSNEQATRMAAVSDILGLRRMLYVANIGDSRAILSHAGKAIRLTEEHTMVNDAETERMNACGMDRGTKRVFGKCCYAALSP